MVVYNPNNWHWVEKNCLPWTANYLNEHLLAIQFESDDITLQIASIDTVSGDCNVSQRKGKVICIYDMSLKLSVKGSDKTKDSEVSGTISLSEFFHDQDEDEYNFNIDSEYKAQIKSKLIPLLLKKLMGFQNDLITAHENEIQHNV